MAVNAELRINLANLKRQDPYIHTIVDSSTHVAVYSFSPQTSEWEKTDVEGTLFVYKRVAPPFWGFTIMNRLSMENLIEPLMKELEFQTQNPFLLYRNAKLLIYGIWFFDQDDCKRIGKLLEKLCEESTNPFVNIVASKDSIPKMFPPVDITGPDGSVPKSVSPTSNSVASISPGSSVGGLQRQASNNGEADSESDEKDSHVPKASVNILDLLSKAQDKYEKEKRNTPDPAVEITQIEVNSIQNDAERQLVKPVPLHPQKLDVATLFKKVDPSSLSMEHPGNNLASPILPLSMTPVFPGILMQPQPSANINIPQQRRPQITRSFSMTEMAMRQQAAVSINTNVNGGVMSLEEVEGNYKNPNDTRQQHVNSVLDKLIDRINSGKRLPAGSNTAQSLYVQGNVDSSRLPHVTSASSGNSGSMVVNGNTVQSVYAFQNEEVFTNSDILKPLPSIMLQISDCPVPTVPKQRSISLSALQSSYPTHMPTVPSAMFPVAPVRSSQFPFVPVTIQMSENTNSSIQENAMPSKHHPSLADPTVFVSTVTTEVSVPDLQLMKQNLVSLTNQVVTTSSSAIPTTLISPEDFELSALTPQKKLEIKKRLAREVQSNQSKSAISTNGPGLLTKEQLQQTLVFLLQKDTSFLATIHDAYLSSFQHS